MSVASRIDRADRFERIYRLEYVVTLPDFNDSPLNGATPEIVKKEFGVEVALLGQPDSKALSYPIVVGGPIASVTKYLRHLRSTWPDRKPKVEKYWARGA
jgi:hypothetical protein